MEQISEEVANISNDIDEAVDDYVSIIVKEYYYPGAVKSIHIDGIRTLLQSKEEVLVFRLGQTVHLIAYPHYFHELRVDPQDVYSTLSHKISRPESCVRRDLKETSARLYGLCERLEEVQTKLAQFYIRALMRAGHKRTEDLPEDAFKDITFKIGSKYLSQTVIKQLIVDMWKKEPIQFDNLETLIKWSVKLAPRDVAVSEDHMVFHAESCDLLVETSTLINLFIKNSKKRAREEEEE